MSTEEFEEAAPSGPPPRGPRQKAEPPSQVAEELSREDDNTIGTWLRSIGSGAAMRLSLIRVSPKIWEGHQVGGHLDDFDEPFTENDVRTRFGGGKFQVKVQKMTSKGTFQYAGARTIEISGDPKITGELHGGGSSKEPVFIPPMGEDVKLSERAMNLTERLLVEERRRSDALASETRSKGSYDPGLLEMLTMPLRDQASRMSDQLDDMKAALEEKDRRIMELIERANAPKANTIQDTITEKLLNGESARLDSLRSQFESERRQLLQSHKDEIDRNRAYFENELLRREEAHKRELQSIRDAHDSRVESLKQGYEGRMEVQKGRIDDLNRQITEAKTELIELRAKKEKNPVEQMKDLAEMKNAMEMLGMGGKDEAEPPSTWERVLHGVMESPLAQGIAARIQTAPPAPPPDPRAVRAALRRQRGTGPVAPGQGPPVPMQNGVPSGHSGVPAVIPKPPKPKKPLTQFDPGDVATARSFIEGAIRQGTPPEEFARAAALMIPGDFIKAIRDEGIDAFLARVVRPEPNSILTTVQGKQFLRKVLKALNGDAPEAAAVPAGITVETTAGPAVIAPVIPVPVPQS